MLSPRKAVALAASLVTALSAAAIAQAPPPAGRPNRAAAPTTLVIQDARIDWIEKSDVAALREGVIDKMELQIGMPVARGKPIGSLHNEVAALTVKRAALAAKAEGARMKAVAQKDNAVATLARLERLGERGRNFVSMEELDKARAELKVTVAMIEEAVEKQGLDKADLDLAERALEEHTITAPFDGIVIDRMKNPGESVRANEAVVRLGNLDKLRAFAFVPLEYAYRVKEGGVVEIQLQISRTRGERLPIEEKKFRGKISFVDPQIQPVAETAVRIYADFENKDHELRPGLNATMTIYLDPEGAPAPPPTVGVRTVSPAAPR